MNHIHLARTLGTLTPSSFQKIQKESFLNSIVSQPYATFGSTAPRDLSQASPVHASLENSQSTAHRPGTNCLTLDQNDGRFLISGGADASIRLWDLESSGNGDSYRYFPTASLSRADDGAHTHAITAVAIYPFDLTPSTLITASHDKSVKLSAITPTSLEPVHTFPLDYGPYTVALSNLSSAHPLVAVGTAHPVIRLLDLRSGLGTHSLPGHNGSVYSIDWSQRYEYLLCSGGSDGRVLFFDIRRASAAFASLDLDDAIGVVGDDPSTGGGARKPLDWNTRAHAGPVTGVQWTPSGDKIVTAGHDQRIRIWDAATGRNDLVHFGPRIRNDRKGPLMPLISPRGYVRTGRELLYWPNDDGKGDIYVHSFREGNLIRILSTPGVQRTDANQGKRHGSGKLTSGGRINGMVWRTNASSGRGIELYTAHGDGRIVRWGPENESDHENENNAREQDQGEQDQARKRKRELVGDLVAGLSNKSSRT